MSQKRKAFESTIHTQEKKRSTNVEVLFLPVGLSQHEEKFADFILKKAFSYVAQYGFFVFQKDEEFAGIIGQGLNTARLALLYELSFGSNLLHSMIFKHTFLNEKTRQYELSGSFQDVLSKYIESQSWEKQQQETKRKVIVTLFDQLLALCSNNVNRIIAIIRTQWNSSLFYEDRQLLFPNYGLAFGEKPWNVVILLEKKTRLYIGHVRMTDPDSTNKRCDMISIRQSLANAVLRDSNCTSPYTGIDRIAHRLLTQVMQKCQEKGGESIQVISPFGRMPKILKQCGFNSGYYAEIEDIPLRCWYS